MELVSAGDVGDGGSPMVFQTAPPQPASKARMICSPALVGGAEASQKGLRQGMVAKVVSRVGMIISRELLAAFERISVDYS